MRALLLLRLVLGSHGVKFPDHQAVEYQDKSQWSGESQDQRVQNEGGVGVRVLSVWPLDVAGHIAVARLHGAGKKDNRQHQQHGCHPGEGRNQLGYKGRSVARRGYGMANGYVAIRRHDQQEDRGGEGGDRGAHHVGLAHIVAEGPVAHLHCVEQEGNADQEALIRDSQIQYVYVGYSLHLGESHHHIDHQGVAKESNDADQCVQDHRDELQDEVVAVRTVRAIIVVLQIVTAILLRRSIPVVQVGSHTGHHCFILSAIYGWIRLGLHGLQLMQCGAIWRHCQLLCGCY